ncbi:MAG: outer membrane lipoprotein-sorting protein [Chrysiogenales bacterium]|nr:MAG: outer membrane lipoprotein-sorting protein [Chrysiogenales bacterium]
MGSIKAVIIAAVLLACVTAHAMPKVGDIIKKIDFMMEQIGDISVKASLVQNKARQGVKNYESLYFRRDKTDEFLIVILAPDTEKGNGYLRVGENFWMYRQNTRTFQHISRDESIMGTDAKGGDFEKKKLVDLYMPMADKAGREIITEEMLGKKPVYKFILTAKVSDVTYPKQVYWVERDSFLTLKIQSYSLSGTLMQTAYFPRWTVVDGKYIPIQHIYIDEFEKGNKTIVELSGISTRTLDPRIFTKAYLENLSK